MKKCWICGKEFDVEDTRDAIDSDYGRGAYDAYYSANDACEECARIQMSNGIPAGNEIKGLMGSNWDE